MADANALVLSVSADTSRALKELDKLNKKLDGLNDNAQKSGKKTKAAIDGLFGKPSAALDKIFDSTRFKVFDSGAARVGLFGSSLEKLGVAGLGAAAAIGAVAFALNQAGEAIKFTDELEDTANRLHITTDALQEYRFAIRAAGGDEKGADEALAGFSETLGKAQAGLPKAIKGFKELGFTDAQIKGFADTQDALGAVIDKISQLKSPAQKDAVASQLGLTGIKELTDLGVDGVTRLREEAHKAGVVFDAELIRKASGLHDQIETINARINIDMKAAFVGLGPVLLDLKKGLAGMLETVLAILDAFKKVGDRSEITLRGTAAKAQGQIDSILKQQAGGDKTASLNTALVSARARLAEANAALTAKAAATDAALKAQDAKNKGKGTGSLIPQNKAGASGPSAASQQKHFDDELARISQAILAASDNERHTIEERAKIARDRLEAEITSRDQSVKDQLATKAITAGQAKILLAKNKELASVQRVEQDTAQIEEIYALQLKNEQALVGAVTGLLDAQLGLTHSAQERAALEAEILTAQRKMARKFLAEALANDPNKSDLQKSLELGVFDRTTGALQQNQTAKARDAIAAERLSVSQAGLDAEIDATQLADQLAETAAGRRDNELKLLDLQDRKLRAEYESTIASETASKADKEIAQKKLDSLNATAADRREGVKAGTRGPLEQLGASLPTDAAKMNEALQSVASQGLQSLEDGLVGVITHTKKLGDVFREVASQIIADLARIAIQKAIIAPLENAISLGLSSGASAIFGGHRASGGPVSAGRVYEVGERGRELFVPRVSGSIIPNSAIRNVASMSGGAGPAIIQQFHLHAEGAVMTDQLIAGLRRDAAVIATVQAEAAAGRAVRSGPGYLAAYQNHNG